MTEKGFKNGEIIFRQWERGNSLFQVQEGCVGIFTNYGEEQEKKLAEVKKDQFFGEMAVIESYPRSATAVSLSDDTKVLEIAGDEIRKFLSENPDNIMDLMTNLSDRLQELTVEYNDVSAVIGEMKDTEKEKRSDKLRGRIRSHITAYQDRKNTSLLVSAEYFNDMMEERHSREWYEKVKEYPTGTIICRQGETIHCMYEIHRGRVGVYTDYKTDAEQKIAELYPNTFFGEAGMLTDEPRSATVVALEDTTVEIFYREDLEELAEKNPAKLDMILRNISYRLRYLTDRYLEACAIVAQAAREEEENGKVSPETAQKIKEYKNRLYD